LGWKRFPHTVVKITNVKITKAEYPAFTKDESIIDCNSVTKHSIDEIIEMFQSNGKMLWATGRLLLVLLAIYKKSRLKPCPSPEIADTPKG